MPHTDTTAVHDPASLADYGTVLEVLSAQVAATAKHMEDSVTRVCSSFTNISRRTRENANQAAIAGTKDGGVLATAQATIAGLLTRMDKIQRAAEESIETLRRIEAIGSRVDHIQRSLQEVDQVAHALKILALNARMEAARAGAHGSAFGVVASETGVLANAVRATATSVREMVEALWADVSESTKRMRSGLLKDQSAADIRRVADQNREEGNRALTALTRAHADMQTLVKEAAANSARLAEDIGEAIIALQFQDAVNQQLEHVQAALDETRQGLLTGDAVNAAELLDRLRARATMQSERQVLDQVTKGGTKSGPANHGAVELF